MKHILYLTTFFIFGLFYISCRQTLSQKEDNYPNDTSISNFQGKPKNLSTLYFPYYIKNKDTIKHTNLDTIINELYSFTLYKFKEPVLSNYYLGQDMYRFIWLRSFHRPVIITLTRNNKSVKLITKEFDEHAHYFEFKRCTNCDTTNFKDPKLILNETKELTLSEWGKFESLLTDCNFWNIQPYKSDMGTDGSKWNIEAHLQEKYWFVDRWTPRDKFAECGKYLIKLSGLKEDIY